MSKVVWEAFLLSDFCLHGSHSIDQSVAVVQADLERLFDPIKQTRIGDEYVSSQVSMIVGPLERSTYTCRVCWTRIVQSPTGIATWWAGQRSMQCCYTIPIVTKDENWKLTNKSRHLIPLWEYWYEPVNRDKIPRILKMKSKQIHHQYHLFLTRPFTKIYKLF